MINYINCDISQANVDIIVNASNGCGYMGGRTCSNKLKRGTAESMNYYTNGMIEKQALISARKFKYIPSFICGTPCGEIFITESCGLNCKKVIHAVTMKRPGSKAKFRTIKKLYPIIFDYCYKNGYKSVAVPLLGTGTGQLNRNDVMVLLSDFDSIKEIEITVYCNF